MEAVLGEHNVSGIGLEEFDGNHRFALKQLYGKLFNPCSEPTTSKILQTNLLKKATGQDTIEAEIKGKQERLPFRNCSKITVLANRFPKINDNTTAFKERRLFIKFPNEFLGNDQIQNIENNWLKINDERSGILNWMLEGLQRLLKQGYFTESKTQQETEAEFLRASDTISSFLKEMVIFDKNSVTTRSDVLEAYTNYCDVLGLDAENEKKFTARLKETPKISVTLIRKPKQERAWKGLSLKQIDDEGKISKNNSAVTLDTLDTAKGVFHPQTNVSQSLDLEESSTRVSSVSSVSNPNQKAEEQILDQSQKINYVKESHYRLLIPSENQPCNRYNCSLLSKYQVDSGFFCETHGKEVLSLSQKEGFKLIEDQNVTPDFEDKCEPPEEGRNSV
jgi:phage/plasmid-associated DNA primase